MDGTTLWTVGQGTQPHGSTVVPTDMSPREPLDVTFISFDPI